MRTVTLILSLGFTLMLSWACQPKAKVVKGSSGPLCGLFDNSSRMFICIEYPATTTLTQVEANCNTERNNYSSETASIRFTVSQQFYCDKDNVVGKCLASGQKITYYGSEFGPGSAESECYSRGGTFQ